MTTALVLTRLRTCSASLTAPADSSAYSYPAFIVAYNMGANMHFPGAGLMPNLLAWTNEMEAISTSCTTCKVKSSSELVWSLHSRLQNHKGILLASWSGYFSFYHTNALLFWVGSRSKALIFGVGSSTEVTASAAWTSFEVNCSTSVFR